MDIRKIKKMIELLEESGIAEIEIKEGEETLRIARVMPGQQVMYPHAPLPPTIVAASAAPEPRSASAAAIPGPVRAAVGEHIVAAPMVGTYYSAASPGAKSFVEIGTEIKVGQILCIIEAMKMMNQIEADKAGRITSVMARNGDPVEFGQPLFVVE